MSASETKDPAAHARRQAAVRVCLGLLGAASLLWLADTGLAVARGWQPLSRCGQLAMAAAGLPALLCAAAVLVPALRRRWAGRGSRCILAGGAFVAALLPAEGALWLWFGRDLPYPLETHLRPPRTQTLFEPDLAIIPGASAKVRFTVNRAGLRGRDLPAARAGYRILCVGGSTTECLYLDDARAWPALLEQDLTAAHPAAPVWVGNAGISGLASGDHLRFLYESAWLARVDAVVVQAGVNDLARTLEGAGVRGLRARAPLDAQPGVPLPAVAGGFRRPAAGHQGGPPRRVACRGPGQTAARPDRGYCAGAGRRLGGIRAQPARDRGTVPPPARARDLPQPADALAPGPAAGRPGAALVRLAAQR